MPILAIDTATRVTAAAVLDQGRLIAESAERSRNHSRTLLAAIDRMLGDNQLTPDTLSGVAVGVGPGSFTGIRVGLTLAKTLAYALELPLVGVSTLRALAENGRGRQTALICPALDALKGEVFCACYKLTGDRLDVVQPEAAQDPAAWAADLAGHGEACLILGSAIARYRQLFEDALGEQALIPDDESLHNVHARAVGELAQARLAAGDSDDPRTLEPLYCRLSEAELKK